MDSHTKSSDKGKKLLEVGQAPLFAKTSLPGVSHAGGRPGIGSALMNRTKTKFITDTILAPQKNAASFVFTLIDC